MKYYLSALAVTLSVFVVSCGDMNSKDQADPAASTPSGKLTPILEAGPVAAAATGIDVLIKKFCPSNLSAEQSQNLRKDYEDAINRYKRCFAKAKSESDKEDCRLHPKAIIVHSFQKICEMKIPTLLIEKIMIEELLL